MAFKVKNMCFTVYRGYTFDRYNKRDTFVGMSKEEY